MSNGGDQVWSASPDVRVAADTHVSKSETWSSGKRVNVPSVPRFTLGGILWRIPAKPLTLGQMRAARTNGTSKRNVMDGVAVVYVQDGSVNMDNLENPLPAQVENTVEAEIVR